MRKMRPVKGLCVCASCSCRGPKAETVRRSSGSGWNAGKGTLKVPDSACLLNGHDIIRSQYVSPRPDATEAAESLRLPQGLTV